MSLKSSFNKSLVAHYPLSDESIDSSIARDSSGHSRHLELRNGVTTGVSGPYGNNTAISMDGADDYGAIQDLYYNTSGAVPELTVTAWVKIPSGGGDWSIVDFDRSEYYTCAAGIPGSSVSGTGEYVGFHTFGNVGGDMWSNSTVRDNNWHHIAWVFEAGATDDKRIYIDGSLDAGTNQHNGSALGTGITRYGFVGDGSEAGQFDGGKNKAYYEGDISDIRVYHRTLLDQEIEELSQMRSYYAINV